MPRILSGPNAVSWDRCVRKSTPLWGLRRASCYGQWSSITRWRRWERVLSLSAPFCTNNFFGHYFQYTSPCRLCVGARKAFSCWPASQWTDVSLKMELKQPCKSWSDIWTQRRCTPLQTATLFAASMREYSPLSSWSGRCGFICFKPSHAFTVYKPDIEYKLFFPHCCCFCVL